MKVVICGAGETGQAHYEAFSGMDAVSVAAIADPVAERIGRFGERGVHTFADGSEMLKTVEADIAVIATPTAFHAPLAIEALKRGMHVFCEKPMARTVADGKAMLDAARKAKRKLGIGYVLRFHDAYLLARDYIREGKLGNIGVIRTSRCACDDAPWRKDIEANGGAVFELLTHDLDWLCWAAGPIKRVFARGLSKGSRIVERDYCLAIVRFASGAIAHLEGSLAEVGQFYASYEIAGDAGLLSYDSRKTAIIEGRLVTAGGLRELSETPQDKRPFEKQLEAFVRAIREDDHYEVDGPEGLNSLVLTAAVMESLQAGQSVDL